MNLFKNIRRRLSLFFVLILIVNMLGNMMLGNTSLVKASDETGGFSLTSIELEKEGVGIPWGNPIAIEGDTRITLILNWAIADDTPINAGDVKTVQIPEIFLPVSGVAGDMIMTTEDDDEIIIGTYSIDGNNILSLTFNDELKLGGEYEEDRHGTVVIEFLIDVTKFNDDINKEIDFGYGVERYPIVVKSPSSHGSSIDKRYTKEEINPTYVDWTIDINTNLASILDAIVSDTVPEGLSLLEDSLKVEKLKVGYNGAVSSTGEFITDTVKAKTETTIAEGSFSLSLGEIKEAYRITYRTKIDTYGKPEYKNEAILWDGTTQLGTDIETVPTLTRGSLIKKVGTASKYDGVNSNKINWGIDVNQAEMQLSNVVIEDIPDGNQVIDISTIEVWELVKAGVNWAQSNNVTEEMKALNGGTLEFPITLGNLEGKAYRIKFTSDIVYPEDYVSQIAIKNEAILTADDDIEENDDVTVNVTRGELLTKETVGDPTIEYDKKEIKWKLEINKGKHNITNATLHDILPAGLTIDRNSIVVKVGGVTRALSEFSTTPDSGNIVGGGGTEANPSFTINFGNIVDEITIEYTTFIHDSSYYGTQFNNMAWLTGGGIGSGSGPGSSYYEIISKDITPSILNLFTKYTIPGNVTIGGVIYDGINYANKTMSWRIQVQPLKEGIEKLTITDTFPNKGQYFIKDSLRFVSSDNTVILDDNYEITDIAGNDIAYQNGFILTYEGSPLAGETYNIYFKTSFDTDLYSAIEANVAPRDGNNVPYNNKAEFKYIPEGGGAEVTRPASTASYNMNYVNHDHGNKEVINYNLQERWIDWRIRANHQGKVIPGTELVITDTFSAGQSLDEETMVITQYSVNANNSTTDVKQLVKGADYTIDYNSNDRTFTIKILAANKDKPHRIEYRTIIEGLAKNEYTNTATIEGKNYTAKVTNQKYNKFLTKTTKDGNITNAYRDDEIVWKVVLNESLSEITNGVFIDEISGGHEYVEGSLKVYEVVRNNNDAGTPKTEPESPDTYTLLAERDNTTGEWTLTLAFNQSIHKQYQIEYSTVVTKAEGAIKNEASFNGTEVVSGTPGSSDEKNISISKSSSGTGTGSSPRGNLRIEKVDLATGDLITSGVAEFELYYLLNGNEIIVDDVAKETVNGVVIYSSIPTKKTYYLRELTPPTGYLLDEDEIIIAQGEINTGQTYTVKVENEKEEKDLKITKVDVDNLTTMLPDAEFDLYRIVSTEPFARTLIGRYPTSLDGTVTISGLKDGNYELEEVIAPTGYQLSTDIIQITINKEADAADSIKDNTINYTAVNEKKLSLSIKKVDFEDDSKGLGNTEFKLYRTDVTPEKQIGGTYVTEADGTLLITGLDNGIYRLVETKASIGYQLPENPNTTITVGRMQDEEDGTRDYIVHVEDITNKQLKSVKVKKVSTENPSLGLEGAEFRLYDVNNIPVGGLYTTDENGEFTIPNLEVGEYKLIETKAPNGYALPKTPETIIVIAHDTEYDYVLPEIANEVTRTIKIVKYDEAGTTPLKNAKFDIYKDGVKFTTVITDDDGEAVIDELLTGEYTLTETEAPTGYQLLKDSITINIEKGAAATITRNITNDKLRAIEITKVAADNGNVLAKAEFELYNEAGVLVANGETDELGKLSFEDLSYGVYTLKEIKAPNGYTLLSAPIEIVLNADTSLIYEIEVKNNKVPIIPPIIPNPEPEPTPTPIPEPTPEPTPTPEAPSPTPTPGTPTPTPETPQPTPTPPTEKTTTPKEEPKVGEVPVPEGGTTKVKEPPTNGTITIDVDGNWTYVPMGGFTGKDRFVITVIDEDGNEQDFVIEIDVEDIPLGNMEGNIPKTGESILPIIYLLAAMLLLLSAIIVQKKKKDLEME